MMKIRFELHFKNFGKPRLKRRRNRWARSIQAPNLAVCLASSRQTDVAAPIPHVGLRAVMARKRNAKQNVQSQA
jgi:hypothetical protein